MEWTALQRQQEKISRRLSELDQEVRRLDVTEVLEEKGYRIVEERGWEEEEVVEMDEEC